MGLMRWFRKTRDRVDRSNKLLVAIRCGQIHYMKGWDGALPHIEVRGQGWIFFPLTPEDSVGCIPENIRGIFSGGAEDIFWVFPKVLVRLPRGAQVVGGRVTKVDLWLGDPNGTFAHTKTSLGQTASRNIFLVIEKDDV